MLRNETAVSLGDWIFEDIICHWGTLTEIVSDNGGPFVKTLAHLSKKYHINHIHISGYNSCANGLVEQTHFDIWQSLFKAVDGDQTKWSRACYSVFWANRATVRHFMGCSPYFTATGTHPILPFNIGKATYLLPPPDHTLSTTELITNRVIALQKCQAHLANLVLCRPNFKRQFALNVNMIPQFVTSISNEATLYWFRTLL
jgi:hypothetical protein